MEVAVGTFNLNNLFSRYNFKGEIKAIKEGETEVEGSLKYEFGTGSLYKIRTYMGRLVKGKDRAKTELVAKRIADISADVLAVQEVEDIDTLREFNRHQLNGMYSYCILVEGNDPRLIDLGLLSKLPLGAVTSWQHAVHPADPAQPVFGRDLLEVEVWNSSRAKKLFTIFNNHLKSHYVPWNEDQATGESSNNDRRKRQSEMVREIVRSRTRPNSRYLILGDMNDPPDSPFLSPFVDDDELDLTNALADPDETRPPKSDTPPPSTKAWTHRYKKSGQPARYELYDQIWLSPSLAAKQSNAWIDRRTKHGGDGSDHDPAWVVLDL